MAVLGYLTPKEKRARLEEFGMVNCAIQLYRINFYIILFHIIDTTTKADGKSEKYVDFYIIL